MYRYDCRVPVLVLDGLELTDLGDFDRLLVEDKGTAEKMNFMLALIFAMKTAFYEHNKRAIEKGAKLKEVEEPVYEDILSLSNTELAAEYTKCAEIIVKELTLVPKGEKKKKVSRSRSTSQVPAKS